MKKSRHKKSNKKILSSAQAINKKQELDTIFNNRTGGAVNIRGLSFQLLYACHRILIELTKSCPEKKIRLEGIEDVDIIDIENSEYIQLKTSVNPFDAGKFWELGVLQNFLKVHKIDQNSKLKLVHNTTFSKGHLANLAERKLTQSDIDYWTSKLNQVDASMDISVFLASITFQKESDNTLVDSCIKQLIEKFNLSEGNYLRYFQALHHNVFLWSRDRQTITWKNIQNMIQEVTDSFSKAPSNLAIRHNWTKKIAFDQSVIEDQSYFDGKAARPYHITQKLPVRRNYWEKQIKDNIELFDVTVIRSSSGQGKSTLAWCVAKELSDIDYSIYELQYCEDHTQVAGLYDFLITRLKIGEKPVLIIDGLNSSVTHWSKLVEQLRGTPIKVIVTTRQEDWYRYGADASRVRLKVVDIYLSMEEAKQIFQQIKSKGKLNSTIKTWEPIWEAIEEKKLLIEYVFLLTRGEMIAERISYQIKELNREKGAVAKTEVLRLISLADTLNIKISTDRLTEFIQSTLKFETDRGEVYKQLENEYYLKFDSKYVEGLHPIRSQHLVDVLHETISLKSTLVSVFRIIEQSNVFDFFANLTLNNNNPDDIKGVYESIAPILADKNFGWKVKAIDGLLYYDVHKYWLENKLAFDEVFTTGALDLFVMDMVPSSELGILKDLGKTLSDDLGNGYRELYERKKQFTSFKLENTETAQFVRSILEQLPDNYQSFDDYGSLSFLVGWVVKLGIPLKKKLQFEEKVFMYLIDNSKIQDLMELSNYFNTIQDKDYIQFCKTHKSELLSILKMITDSVIIEETGNDIIVKYLLKDEEISKSNEASVSRIETIFNFLPNYERYRAEAIILPFPTADAYKIVLMNAEKAMLAENIPINFDVHLNQIWRKTIVDKYRASSSFEWQEQNITSRKFALEFVKLCTRYFEAEVENNTSRIRSTLEPLAESAVAFFEYNKIKRDYPGFRRTQTIEPIKAELKKIESWSSAMRNFSNQFFSIVRPKQDNARNVAYRNLESVMDNLPQMQQAFDRITDQFTAKYIDVEQLKKEEREWYKRLFIVVQYYIEVYLKSKGTAHIQNAKNQLENWLEERKSDRLNQLHSIINDFTDSYFYFHLPNQIIEKEKNTYAIIGVDCIESGDEEDIVNLSIGLRKFSQLDIDYFIFVNVINNGAIGAFRCHKNYFERIYDCVETGEDFDQGVYGNPLPIDLNDISLHVLEDIYIKSFEHIKESDTYVKMMYDIWRLQQYRNMLDHTNTIEQNWLKQKEHFLKEKIQSNLIDLKDFLDEDKYNLMNKWITDVFDKNVTISEEEIVNQLTEWSKEVNDSLLTR